MALLEWGFSEDGAGGFHDVRVATRVAGNHGMTQYIVWSRERKASGTYYSKPGHKLEYAE